MLNFAVGFTLKGFQIMRKTSSESLRAMNAFTQRVMESPFFAARFFHPVMAFTGFLVIVSG